MKNLYVISVALIALLALSSCDKKYERIAGKWSVIGTADPMIWEFTDDGKAITGDSRGRYNFGDNDKIKIETPSATFVYTVEFSGDRMIWKTVQGSKIELKRVN